MLVFIAFIVKRCNLMTFSSLERAICIRGMTRTTEASARFAAGYNLVIILTRLNVMEGVECSASIDFNILPDHVPY